MLIGFTFFLSWLSKISAVQIVNIEVSGNSAVSGEEIKSLMTEESSKKYLLLFSKNSRLLYPKKQIKTKILNDLKGIEKIEVKFKGLKTVVASIIERKPNSVWCADTENDTKSKNSKDENIAGCYFLDKEGMVFSNAPDFSGETYVHYYGLLDGSNPIGKIYLPSAKFEEISDFLNSLKVLGIIISQFHAETESDYEIYLENESKIIIDDKQPFGKTLANLESILSELGIGKGLSASSSIKLDYVDLRFGNKVFYKTK